MRKGQKKDRWSVIRSARVVTMVVMFLGVGTLVFSQSGQEKVPPPVRDYTPAPVKNGKKYVATKEIIFDQPSGKLRKPTTEETQALVDQISSLTNRSTDGLGITQHANGMQSMSLDGRFGSVLLGRALEDGTTEIRCVTTLQEALEFLGLEESISQQ